jgi:uncharacterized membrane protein
LHPAPVPLSPLSLAPRASTGALWGLAVAGLFAPRLPRTAEWAVAVGLGTAGALLAIARRFPGDALRRPRLAAAAAACGVAMAFVPEPAFFLLVPLLAAGIAWPFGTPPTAEQPLPRGTVTVLFLLGAAVFFLQSAHRHWTFASGGLDLGLFYQTQWLMARGLPLENTVLGMHALADHMLFGEALVARLLNVYDGAETLLLVQAMAVASAVFPLYGMGRRLLGRPRGALALPLAWLLAPDIHSGVMFDYNPTSLGAAALVWTAWALACRGPVAALLMVLLACAIKENLCLYVAVMAGVMAMRLISWRRAVAVAFLAVSVFAVEMVVLFPWFREGGFRHWEFDDLGQGPAEIFTSIARRPDHAGVLLVDQTEKRRSLLQPMAASGYVMTIEPAALLMQLPNWGERFLSSRGTRWWGYYYGMPAVATAMVGLLMGWLKLQRAGRAGPHLPAYVVACAALVGLAPPYPTHDGDSRSILYTPRRPYASAPGDVETQEEAVAFVGHDPKVKVAAQHHLIPHLAGRPFIVALDRAAEADVVVLQLNGATWPSKRKAWKTHLRDLWSAGTFHVAFCRLDSVVLRRGAGESVSCPSWERLLASPVH